MAEVKWIKITTNMFEDEKIDFIESLPEADAILVIWVKLLTLAGKCNAGGYILLTENIPYTDEMLAHKFRRPLNTVKLALGTFIKLGMIQTDEKGFFLSNWEKHQNLEGLEKIKEQNRLRKQKQRERKKQLQAPVKEELGATNNNEPMSRDSHVTSQLSHATEEEVEEDIEVDIDKEEAVEEEVSKKAAATFQDVINIFNNNIHMITPLESQKLSDWSKDMQNEVLIRAIEEAVYYNKRNMGYINAILNSWHDKNIKTIQDVEAYFRDREDKKEGRNEFPSRNNKDHGETGQEYDFSKYEV